MSSKNNSFLDQLGNGFLTPKGQLSTWQHASRTFQDDYFRLAPKSKFLYHVYFNINAGALKGFNFLKDRHQNEIGLLVKSANLPKFDVKTATLNQYNRKKVIQLTHNYSPVQIKFHDDRANIINNLWLAYYSYYYADTTSAGYKSAYARNATKSSGYLTNKYGLDNNSSIPFFNEIILYQINKREYASYSLINPVITSFTHDQVASSDQGTQGSECNMQLAYEAVKYDTGLVRSGAVKGFAVDHYDRAPSPLSAAGGGTTSVFGTGGILEGAADVFGALATGRAFDSPANFLNTAITAVNTYQNTKRLTNAGLREEGRNIIIGATLGAGALAVSGLKGVVMPKQPADNENVTKANQIDLGSFL